MRVKLKGRMNGAFVFDRGCLRPPPLSVWLLHDLLLSRDVALMFTCFCIHPHAGLHITLCWDDMSSGKRSTGIKRAPFEKRMHDSEAIFISKRCAWLCSAPAGDICTALTPLTFK